MSSDHAAVAELARRVGSAGPEGPDLEAEAEVVRRFSRGLQLMLLHLTGNRGTAEDLHQETFRLVIEKLRAGEIREPERLAGFIRGIARNLVLAERRRRSRGRLVELETAESLEDSRADPLEELMAEEDRLLVGQLMTELRSDRDRQVLRRLYLDGESRESICDDLGLGRTAFNLVVFRARDRFKKLLETRARAAPSRDVKSNQGSRH